MTIIARTPARLTGRTIARRLLTDADVRGMFGLLSASFGGVDAQTFAADLGEKSHVILLDDDDGVLRGFSTLLVYSTNTPEGDATVVYSGDTIVDREWWGSPALAVSWLRAAWGLTSRASAGNVYWLLLTSGFRTYRFLPVFWREFYPRFDMPSEPRALIDAIARERFGDRYDAGSGIVRFARPQVLVPELLDVPAGRTDDPHVEFFLARNPGYVHGDELVCLTNIGAHNLTPAGRRIARMLDREA
ncbi:MAG TPA: hypothetical protein VFJ02_17810 [Vicinamibacterales bacterium]|nr:hypothetical protein [Vicinamibacterales bacterium]